MIYEEQSIKQDILDDFNILLAGTGYSVGYPSGSFQPKGDDCLFLECFLNGRTMSAFDIYVNEGHCAWTTEAKYNSEEEKAIKQTFKDKGMPSIQNMSGYMWLYNDSNSSVCNFLIGIPKDLVGDAHSYLRDKASGADRTGRENIFDLADFLILKIRDKSYKNIFKKGDTYDIYLKYNTYDCCETRYSYDEKCDICSIEQSLIPDAVKYYKDKRDSNVENRQDGNTVFHLRDALNKYVEIANVDKSGALVVNSVFFNDNALQSLGLEKVTTEEGRWGKKDIFTVRPEKTDEVCNKVKNSEVMFSDYYYCKLLKENNIMYGAGCDVIVDEEKDCFKCVPEFTRVRGKLNQMKWEKNLGKFGVIKSDGEYLIPRSKVVTVINALQSDEAKKAFEWLNTDKNRTVAQKIKSAPSDVRRAIRSAASANTR
jgi:hypothetical protein